MANFPPVSSPTFQKWERLPDEWPIVTGPVFADGGQDTFCGVTVPIRRWRVVYRLLDLTEAGVLDTWYAANKGEHLSFNFTDRDTTVYGGVKCESYERGHEIQYQTMQFRTITFVDRPT